MVTDEQVRRLMKYTQKEKTYGTAAANASRLASVGQDLDRIIIF